MAANDDYIVLIHGGAFVFGDAREPPVATGLSQESG